jgi:hypothetical protein
MTPREPLDSLIDNAASRLTDAKPSDTLRANVMSRIAVERPSRFPWRFVFAGGALASVALVAFVSWQRNPAISNLAVSNPTISNPPLINPTVINSSAHPTAGADASSPLTSTVMRTAALATPPQTFHALNAAEQAWLERGVPALEDPKAPEVTTIHIAAIDIEPLRVAPLVVPALGDEQSR